MRLLRIALQIVLFFLLLGVVVGIGTPNTGGLEKAVLVAVGLGLVWLATRLRTWRSAPQSSSASTPPA
jgi:protein-S-isoprenylcysteine O-methyltransferase Ste14